MGCAGRGLCKGCRVEVEGIIRACLPMHSGRCGRSSVFSRIPTSSRNDHSLHGVSLFEIRTEDAQASRRRFGTRRWTLDRRLLPGCSGISPVVDALLTPVAPMAYDVLGTTCFHEFVLRSTQTGGFEQLQRELVQNSLACLISTICETAGVNVDAIQFATAAGNPIMLHSLAGVSLAGFARFPFRPSSSTSVFWIRRHSVLPQNFP